MNENNNYKNIHIPSIYFLTKETSSIPENDSLNRYKSTIKYIFYLNQTLSNLDSLLTEDHKEIELVKFIKLSSQESILFSLSNLKSNASISIIKNFFNNLNEIHPNILNENTRKIINSYSRNIHEIELYLTKQSSYRGENPILNIIPNYTQISENRQKTLTHLKRFKKEYNRCCGIIHKYLNFNIFL